MRKDYIARELTVEVIVGVFMLMVLFGLGYFTILLSHEAWFVKKQKIEVVFSDIMGLRDGDNVVVRGMIVGKVKDFNLAVDGVHVRATLDRPVSIREDYRAMVVSSSVLGGRYMELEVGSAEMPALSPDVVLKGEDPLNMMNDAAKLIGELKVGLTEGQIIENIQEFAAQIREISVRLREGKGTLGRLLSEEDTLYQDLSATVDALKKVSTRLERGEGALGKLLSSEDTVYEDLKSVVGSLKQVSERLEQGEGTLGRLLSSDDTVYQDLKATVTSLRSVSERLAKGEGTLGRLMSGDDEIFGELTSVVATLKEVADKVKQGEGTVGKLLQDDRLYAEIEGLVVEARAALDDYRENTPVVTFTSILFGAL